MSEASLAEYTRELWEAGTQERPPPGQLLGCARACRPLGAEQVFLKRGQLLSRSLGAGALEKGEKLTASVADLVLKLIRFLWHH